MENPTFKDYLDNRYYNQIKWYSDKASGYKKKYQRLQFLIIILSAITPILAATDLHTTVSLNGATANLVSSSVQFSQNLKMLLIILTALVGIFTTLLKVFRYYENWINYRSTSEKLSKEIHYFNNNAGAYKGVENKESFFVERVEDILSGENSNWNDSHKNQTAS